MNKCILLVSIIFHFYIAYALPSVRSSIAGLDDQSLSNDVKSLKLITKSSSSESGPFSLTVTNYNSTGNRQILINPKYDNTTTDLSEVVKVIDDDSSNIVKAHLFEISTILKHIVTTLTPKSSIVDGSTMQMTNELGNDLSMTSERDDTNKMIMKNTRSNNNTMTLTNTKRNSSEVSMDMGNESSIGNEMIMTNNHPNNSETKSNSLNMVNNNSTNNKMVMVNNYYSGNYNKTNYLVVRNTDSDNNVVVMVNNYGDSDYTKQSGMLMNNYNSNNNTMVLINKYQDSASSPTANGNDIDTIIRDINSVIMFMKTASQKSQDV